MKTEKTKQEVEEVKDYFNKQAQRSEDENFILRSSNRELIPNIDLIIH